MKRKFTLSRALIWIFCSAIFVNASFFLCIRGYRYWKQTCTIDYKVPIRAIVQTGPQKEALKTTYLAELLGLSVDQPILSSDFDLKQANLSLLLSPIIKEADVKFKEPGILYVDYVIRQPMCFLYDFENIALDAQRVPFPVTPFFSPKRLPEIYLGMRNSLIWNQPITGKKIELAFDLLKILEGPIVCDLFNVKRIDVSLAFEKSCGRREIVLMTEDEIFFPQKEREVRFAFPRLLRLSLKNYRQELSNYLKIREQLLEKEQVRLEFPEGGEKKVIFPQKVLDFRIPQIAFIENQGGK
ncbi:MAG: hypothetical protein KR126chlam3_00264 [Chlamydiae bacterium]|nr:hypothetical protein [Chlamydiota bacterium]